MNFQINLRPKTLSENNKTLFLFTAIVLLATQVMTFVSNLLLLFRFQYYPVSFQSIVSTLAIFALIVLFFVKIANIYLGIPLVILTVFNFINIFRNLIYFFNSLTFYNLLTLVSSLLQFLGVALLVIFVLSLAFENQLFSLIPKVWFVPGLLILVSEALSLLESLTSFFTFGFAIFWNVLRIFFFFLISVLWGAACLLIGKCISNCLTEDGTETNKYASYIPSALSQTYVEPSSVVPHFVEPEVTEVKEEKTSSSEDNLATELQKYKDLFENGLITEEEFSAKKKQLLNL